MSVHDHGHTNALFAQHSAQPSHVDHGTSHQGPGHPFDLARAALDEMHEAGFLPEFSADAEAQLKVIEAQFAAPQPAAGVEDLRGLGCVVDRQRYLSGFGPD